jgi:ferric-dicitrate binding protein FerR (iron transport regulator)
VSITGIYFLPQFYTKKQSISTKLSGINQNRFIQLPDGSLVTIMKNSKLTCSPAFNKGDRREVYLEGQAFFDVKHDASKPFIVHTGKLQITVLGTAFNVSALNCDNKIIVTVTRGKVSVANKNKVLGTITPDQQIVFNKDKANSIMKKVDADTYVQWKEQDLLFDDVTMEEAAKLLKERYKVEIKFTDPELMLNRFTTTFQHDESLEHELDLICDFNNAVYSYDKGRATVIISNKTN